MMAGPSVAACRSRYQATFILLRLKAVVVSDKGKGISLKCQVRVKKVNVSEPLMRHRKD
ncbi:MAG: hypothetical protein QM640_02550 [Niabella sp.]